MRKNYKPHAKQNKIASSYRKKTIDPGVDLNLKKDDDNMENIDDYWNMAEYVMDDDQTLPLKKNGVKEAQELMKKKMPVKSKKNKEAKQDTKQETKQEIAKQGKHDSSKQEKKDKKKKDNKKYVVESLESSVINDVMDISTDASKLTSEIKKSPKKTNKKKSKQTKPENEESEDTLFDINNIRESLSHNTLKKMSNVSNTSGFDMNYDVASFNEISKTNTSEGMQKGKEEKKKKSEKKKDKKSKENKKVDDKKVDDKKSDNKKSENKKVDDKKNSASTTIEESKIQKSENKDTINDSVKRRRSSVSAIAAYKGEPLIGKNNKIYGMTKISSLFQGRSKLEPLITKKSLEAGILFLKPGASILQETADNPFTLFLLKGTIEISMNNEKFKLDRESCMFIDEGSSYDIVDKSRGGSSMFVTFKAK